MYHLLFTFYPFRNEEHLKSPPFSEKDLKKLQESSVMEIVDRNKSLIVPYKEMVDKTLSNSRSDLTNPDTISQQENDKVEEELATDVNNTLDKDQTAESILQEESSLTPAYTTPILLPDSEIDSLIRSVNRAIQYCSNLG